MNVRTLSRVTRRTNARREGSRCLAGSLSIEPFERSRWRGGRGGSVWALNRTEAGADVWGSVVPGAWLPHGELERAKADGRRCGDHRSGTVSETRQAHVSRPGVGAAGSTVSTGVPITRSQARVRR
jgi:hypothetical protein